LSDLEKKKKKYSAVREALKNKPMDPFKMGLNHDSDRAKKIKNKGMSGDDFKSLTKDYTDKESWGQ